MRSKTTLIGFFFWKTNLWLLCLFAVCCKVMICYATRWILIIIKKTLLSFNCLYWCYSQMFLRQNSFLFMENFSSCKSVYLFFLIFALLVCVKQHELYCNMCCMKLLISLGSLFPVKWATSCHAYRMSALPAIIKDAFLQFIQKK